MVADTPVVEYVRAYAKVCLSVLKLETLLPCHVDYRSTNKAEILIIVSSVSDAHVVVDVSGGGVVVQIGDTSP